MASSSEAFGRFSMWNQARRSLKVTVVVNGKTEDVLFGMIAGLDAEFGLVGLAISDTRSFVRFNVEEAEFSLEPKRLTATRNESDWLIFEEVV